MPPGSGSSWHQRVGQAAEQVGLRTACREGEANTGSGLDDPRGNFEKPEPDRIELRCGQIARLGNEVAHGEDEPIGGGVEDEPDLVGKR
jgi:hypothetical protein